MRPALKAGLLPVWRDRDTVQVGIDPRRAVALTGMAGAGRLIALLDGSRDREQLIAASGGPAATVDRVLSLLAAGGALDDIPPGGRSLWPLRARLGAELATASLARGDSDGGARTLARRQAAQVTVHGDGRVAAALAGLLTAAGLGRVHPSTPGLGDALPGQGTPPRYGLSPGPMTPAGGPAPDRGARPSTKRPPDRGTLPRSGGTSPGRRRPPGRGAPAGRPRPDLVIIAQDSLATGDPGLPGRLIRDRIPHLRAQASEAIGVVGPLVLPGQTACLGCLDLARADADPAWPVIAAQVAARPPHRAGCDAPLAAAVAAQATFATLAFIDTARAPAAVTNGTLELVLPAWPWRRRSWLPHPGCDCGSHRPA